MELAAAGGGCHGQPELLLLVVCVEASTPLLRLEPY